MFVVLKPRSAAAGPIGGGEGMMKLGG